MAVAELWVSPSLPTPAPLLCPPLCLLSPHRRPSEDSNTALLHGQRQRPGTADGSPRWRSREWPQLGPAQCLHNGGQAMGLGTSPSQGPAGPKLWDTFLFSLPRQGSLSSTVLSGPLTEPSLFCHPVAHGALLPRWWWQARRPAQDMAAPEATGTQTADAE